MKELEAAEKIKEVSEKSDYCYVGFRFENLDRKLGDVCGNSRHNPDREDCRDFPEYGTAEYDEMPELDGTCAYGMSHLNWIFDAASKDCESSFIADHCYVIASDDMGYNDDPDEGEILLKSPEVIAKIF